LTAGERGGRLALAAAATLALAAPATAAARPAPKPDDPGSPPALTWSDCGGGYQCATATVPLDYSKKRSGDYHVALIRLPARDPAHRLGSLFTNPGGPGASGVDFVRATGTSLYAKLNERYDIVGFDPRGTGHDAIDCKVDQEQTGVYAQPFTTPFNLDAAALLRRDQAYVNRCEQLNRRVLAHVTTADVARDLDRLRAAVGDDHLNYLGFSYGTFLGATYASLFPERLGRVVLDGPVDADEYINHPMQDLAEQTQGFEAAFGRFLQACAADQAACAGFGGSDPWATFDRMAEQADTTPLPATGDAADPRPVDGDDLRAMAIQLVYAKQLWPDLAAALAAAEKGDGSQARFWADYFYARNPDGSYDPALDRYFTIGAVEQAYPDRREDTYLRAGATSWASASHFWFNNGYAELPYGLFGIKGDDVFRGPFHIPSPASTPLVVATTYDPATPYRGATRLVSDLGNARLLTMDGDGHTAYGGNSPCIDAAVEAYLDDGTLPAPGTRCTQDVPFAQPQPQAEAQQLAPDASAATQQHTVLAPHVKPVVAG
jgi:pimeloyl-ACP methyl ester carboxylesterase